MTYELTPILPSAAILGTIAVIAMLLTSSRDWAADGRVRIRRAVWTTAVAVLSQAAHFSEELITGFHQRLPALFGLGPMSLRFFVSFNVAWLMIWSLCVWGVAARHRAALFPLWFLSVACIANGVGHPSFSVLVGGYFPGLVTSPVVGVVGVLLVRQMLSVTEPVVSSPEAA